MHIVNHNYKNEKMLLQKLNFNKIDNIEDIDLNKNYIFYINPNNEIYVTYNFEPVSQIMRIEIAKDLNLLDKYDWRKNNFDDNITLTINKNTAQTNDANKNNFGIGLFIPFNIISI